MKKTILVGRGHYLGRCGARAGKPPGHQCQWFRPDWTDRSWKRRHPAAQQDRRPAAQLSLPADPAQRRWSCQLLLGRRTPMYFQYGGNSTENLRSMCTPASRKVTAEYVLRALTFKKVQPLHRGGRGRGRFFYTPILERHLHFAGQPSSRSSIGGALSAQVPGL